MTTPVTDVSAMVAGQGGDGSLTVVTLLGNLLARRGFHLYSTRNVASRIKGGPAAALVRGTVVPRTGIGDAVDVLVAFDDEAIDLVGDRVAPGGFVVYDSSTGPVPPGRLADTVTVIEIPFGRLAVRDLRRELYKNSLAFGVVSRVMGFDDDEAASVLTERFASRPDLGSKNLEALREGFAFADDHGFTAGNGPMTLAAVGDDPEDRVLITGNEAAAFGFLVAGVRFFAGYPITPATEILDFMVRHLPAFGGVAIQAEDELAAVNMALGASLAGVRSAVATSGPGISLMQEGIGHAGAAELPLVVVDAQRAGPSTGMPTKSEQSDIGMLVHGGNGDFPRIVLAPGNPAEAFTLAVAAVDLSQRIQGPVYLMLDQALSQDAATVPFFDLDAVDVGHPAQLDPSDLEHLDEYRRYAITDDGLSPVAVPGTPGGMNLVTGNEHDEWGKVSTEPHNRTAMMDKRARKIAAVTDTLPPARTFGDDDARIGIVAVGMNAGVAAEAAERLIAAGIPVRGLQPRTIWPIPNETVEFVRAMDRTYVVEHNHEGQLAQLLASAGDRTGTVRSVLRYDGVPHTPSQLADRIAAEETP